MDCLRSIRCLKLTRNQLAQISQLTKELDFPTRRLSKHFHYIGLFEKTPSRNVPFPFETLNGKPVVYASMGTMFGRHAWIFREIAEACAPLNVQLVMTAGGAGNAGELQLLPGSPLAVDYAPQMDILARSRLAISHGGLNTILESLVSGVPMIAVPLYTDQPGNAARLRRSGAGDFIMPGSLTAARLRGLIQKMLESTSYQERANEQRNSIIKAGGSKHAADIIVQALDHEIRS